MNAPPNSPHAHLAERIYNGDRAAEGELFELLHRPLKVMLRARCGDPHLAEDLVQDTFKVLLTRLRDKSLDRPSALASFARKTAVNIWIGHIRKEERRKTDPDSDTVDRTEDDTLNQSEQLERTQEDNAVRLLLKELKNERDKQILYRTFVLDHDKKDVCQALGLTPENFDRVIYRAKSRFRSLVELHMDYQP